MARVGIRVLSRTFHGVISGGACGIQCLAGGASVVRRSVGGGRYAGGVDEPALFDLPTSRQSWHDRPRAGFDLETTSRDPRVARIVSAAVVTVYADGRRERAREWLVDPGVEIPAETTAVHGISTEQVQAEGQDAAEAIPQIVHAVREQLEAGNPVIVFNAPYDFTVLAAEAERHGIDVPLPSPVIDPLVVDKQVDRFRRGKRTLGHVSEHYRITLDDAHSATPDAWAAVEVAGALAAKYPQLQIPAEELHELQIGWKAEQAASLQEYFRRTRPDAVVDPSWPL